MRRILTATAFIVALYGWCGPVMAARSELITEITARQHGLTRPWFTQVALDQGQGHLTGMELFEGVLYAQTDKAVIHALDAETGRTLWWRQVGDPKHPTMTPGVNREFLAVINGSRLYVLNRLTGELLLEREVTGAPGAGPAVSAKRVYVPMTMGMLLAYRLAKVEKPKDESDADLTAEDKAQPDNSSVLRLKQKTPPPMFCQSNGKALVQPIVTRENAAEEFVVWPTDRGFLNLARVDRKTEDGLALKYRLSTGAPIVGRAAYVPPDPKLLGDSGLIITASRDGFVYAFRDKDAKNVWRFSLGDPIVETPAVIGDRVYATAQLGGMYCLALKTGAPIWTAPGIIQFVAASKSRVYATDRIGRIIVLNAATGARLDAIPTETIPLKLLNTVTDRIYLGDDGGLIQCLHEAEQREPLIYSKDVSPDEAAENEKAAKKEAAPKAQPAAKKAADGE